MVAEGIAGGGGFFPAMNLGLALTGLESARCSFYTAAAAAAVAVADRQLNFGLSLDGQMSCARGGGPPL